MQEVCDVFFHLPADQVYFLIKYAPAYLSIERLMYHFARNYPSSRLLKHYNKDIILCRYCQNKLMEIKYGAIF